MFREIKKYRTISNWFNKYEPHYDINDQIITYYHHIYYILQIDHNTKEVHFNLPRIKRLLYDDMNSIEIIKIIKTIINLHQYKTIITER